MARSELAAKIIADQVAELEARARALEEDARELENLGCLATAERRREVALSLAVRVAVLEGRLGA